MEIIPEKYRGPSKLDERLEAFKDMETGHIMLTPDQAKDVLFDTLVSYHRSNVAKMDSKIVALFAIVEDSEVEEKIDYTEKLQIIRDNRDTRNTVDMDFERMRLEAQKISVRGSKQPEQPEI